MRKIIVGVLIGAMPLVAAADGAYRDEGEWMIKINTNKLTDKADVYGMLHSSSGGGTLFIRCENNKTEAFLSIDDYLGSGYNTGVTTRIDGGKPIKSSWTMGEGGDAAFAPKAVSFIKSINGKKGLIIGYSPYGKSQVIAEFDLNGIDKVAGEVSAACGWKL
ncbi:hypothetical protein [Morganella psychrotolerans]|uniref:Uncharacterized protein n=1 Tax=Morganella psychrotolerans TaxID=368603 RepID=A0A1B8H6Q0_9GAMM|nr:hypothetical protein [Morganella psychrotolerans]OBU04741.1 hypothetical protein AYY17_07485 [Morganella psychrotolerans]